MSRAQSNNTPRRHYVRAAILCLTLLVLLSACENSTDPFIGFGGDGAITATQAGGNWSFTVQRTSTLGCTSGSLANGQALTAHLDVLADGTVVTATSTWQRPPETLVRPLSGVITLSTGFASLFMAASAGSSAAMELRGTMTSAGAFTGTLTDPAPGSFQVFGACSYSASGTKTG
jgi:hypothetical protein